MTLSDFGDEVLTGGGINFCFHNIEEVGWFQLQEDPIKIWAKVNAFLHLFLQSDGNCSKRIVNQLKHDWITLCCCNLGLSRGEDVSIIGESNGCDKFRGCHLV